jgi:sodium-dependent phosphate transporter
MLDRSAPKMLSLSKAFLLWFRPTDIVNSYSITKSEHVDDVPFQKPKELDSEAVSPAASSTDKEVEEPARLAKLEDTTPKIEGPWILPRNLYIIARYKVPKVLLHGTSVDIHQLQEGKPGSKHAARMRAMHTHARSFPNKTEYLFSFLQVCTACTASFAHGSNDLANASGPFSVIYHTWSTSTFSGSSTTTPIWIFVFLGLCLVLGLATYGYNASPTHGEFWSLADFVSRSCRFLATV